MIIEMMTLISLFLVIYHHAGYPIILKFIRYFFSSVKTSVVAQDNPIPSITILMPAYNEEAYIAEKIRNLACLDYPSHRLEVVLISDGSTDRTVSVARDTSQETYCKNLRLKVIEQKENRGKVALLNMFLPSVTTDLVALTDVSSLISMDALKICAERFSDPSIGGINGNYRLLNPGSEGEARYWEYQREIKIGEEKLGSVLGAHGAFYMIRPELFCEMPDDTVNDDFVIPMNIVAQGFKVSYEPRLNAVELECANTQQDWRRRLRISFGNAQQVIYLYKLFNPKFKGVAFAFFSGKGLRVSMPFFMIISFLGSLLLSAHPIFFILAACQVFVYSAALGVYLTPKFPHHKILRTIHYLVCGHLANLIGAVRYLSNSKLNSWS
ncbi:MAG: glycosyltransferase family 2 protein [Agarilytica sp.]